jgi:protein tyrosine phosphatase
MLGAVSSESLPEEDIVFDMVHSLREQRISMVQSEVSDLLRKEGFG